jgi:phosphoesterase RecJ-like protein
LSPTSPPIVNIDHHITNTNFGQVNVVDNEASATAEVLYYLLESLGVVMTIELAQCLLAGLVADTLNFSISGVKSDTLRIAADLMDAGADLFEISTQTLKLQNFSTLQIWKVALGNIKNEDGLIWTTVSNLERQSAGHVGSSSFGLGNFLANVYTVSMSAVLLEQEDGRISVGFRCQPPYDVSVIAERLGGGGHRLAAGCSLDGPLAKAEAQVVFACQEAIREQRIQQNSAE